MDKVFRLVVSCPDKLGIVAMVSNMIAKYSGSIREASQHTDFIDDWFFMRYEIGSGLSPFDVEGFRKEFSDVSTGFEMSWRLIDAKEPKKVILMASKDPHCPLDILHRWKSGELNCEIQCMISNHKDMEKVAGWYDLPYYHVPVIPDKKEEAFARINELIEEYESDVVVLARYMQIIPPELCAKYAGRIINIHHSFLPSFVGAKPYEQAYNRGVKLIGATSHYVTEELDAGPIIDQDVVRVSHSVSKEEMIRLGKDVERMVLSRGFRYHLEDRVLIHGNKTVVFD
ncbi:MAG: formyltetrahydrofolate deformylase [Gammaproteobacteria bacterium]|nr:MAG: formyltetrahydrofolate deformylase [Gammaproteobacteria bacterium]